MWAAARTRKFLVCAWPAYVWRALVSGTACIPCAPAAGVPPQRAFVTSALKTSIRSWRQSGKIAVISAASRHDLSGLDCAQSKSRGARCGGMIKPASTPMVGARKKSLLSNFPRYMRTRISPLEIARHNASCASSSVMPVSITRFAASPTRSQSGTLPTNHRYIAGLISWRATAIKGF